MNSIVKILIVSVLAYLFLFASAEAFWLVYPYPENPTQQQIDAVWGIHVLTEKILSYLLTVLISIYTIDRFKPALGSKSIALALFGAFTYHVTGGIVWVMQFGFEPYIQHSMPLKLFFIVLVISTITSVVSYKLLPNKSKHRTQKC